MLLTERWGFFIYASTSIGTFYLSHIFFVSQPTSYTESLESLVFIGIPSDVGYPCNLHQTYIAENVKKLGKISVRRSLIDVRDNLVDVRDNLIKLGTKPRKAHNKI